MAGRTIPIPCPILKDRARNDVDNAVRVAALQELARGWKDDPDTLPLLKDRARNDADNDVRVAALQELARGWKNDLDTLPFSRIAPATMQKLMCGGRRSRSGRALEGRSRYPPPFSRIAPATIKTMLCAGRRSRSGRVAGRTIRIPPPVLKDRAHNDENENVRWTARRELARGWKDDPDTLLPFSRIEPGNDENENVRCRALHRAGARLEGRSHTSSPSQGSSPANDENENVRVAAIHQLARGWKDDIEVNKMIEDGRSRQATA